MDLDTDIEGEFTEAVAQAINEAIAMLKGRGQQPTGALIMANITSNAYLLLQEEARYLRDTQHKSTGSSKNTFTKTVSLGDKK